LCLSSPYKYPYDLNSFHTHVNSFFLSSHMSSSTPSEVPVPMVVDKI
jgi:hypothetical protein